jgi:YggT family protein
MIGLLINLLDILAKAISFLIIVHVLLSYFMSPLHPIRQFTSRIIEPLLTPIRRLVPAMMGIDFSPFVLLLAVQLAEILLINLLRIFL